MLQSKGFDVKVRDLFDSADLEALNHISLVDVVWDAVLASGDIFSQLVGFTTSGHDFS